MDGGHKGSKSKIKDQTSAVVGETKPWTQEEIEKMDVDSGTESGLKSTEEARDNNNNNPQQAEPLDAEMEPEVFILTPYFKEDIIIRTLSMTWRIPDGLTKLRNMQNDLHTAYLEGHHTTLHNSPPLRFEAEIHTDCLSQPTHKPIWNMQLQLLLQWYGVNYLALYLKRGVSECLPRKHRKMGFWDYEPQLDFTKKPAVKCQFEMEILNSAGETVCKRDCHMRDFVEMDRTGWPMFATHPQILENNHGKDLLVKCTLKVISLKPIKALIPSFPDPGSSAPLRRAHSTPDMAKAAEDEAKRLKPGLKMRIFNAIRKLKAEFPNLRLPQKYVTISCEGKRFNVKPLMLAARSTKFRIMFQENHAAEVIELDGSADAVGNMINYLLDDSCSILESPDIGNKVDLLSYAIEYGIEELKLDLWNQMLSSLDVSNVFPLICELTVSELLGDMTEEAYQILRDFLFEHRGEIKESEEFRSDPVGTRKLLRPFFL